MLSKQFTVYFKRIWARCLADILAFSSLLLLSEL